MLPEFFKVRNQGKILEILKSEVFPALGKVQFTTKNGNNIEIEPVGKQIPNIIENENRYCLNIDFFIRINETIDVLQILLGFDEELQMFVSIVLD